DLRSLNPRVSPGFAAIVAKLLAKDPDDRYQSAAGLLADLDRLPVLNGQLQAGRAVVLDAASAQTVALDQTLVVGRGLELAVLQSAWEMARTRHGEAVLLVGEAGSGKSRLVRELLRTLPGTTLVLAGKCSDADVTPLGPF